MSSPMTFAGLLGLSFRAPADAMRALRALKPGPQAVWLGFAIATLLSTIVDSLLFGSLADMAANLGVPLIAPTPFPMPFPMAVSKACLLLLAAFFLTRLAALTEGGEHPFMDVLLALVWFRTVAALATGPALVLFLLAPGMGLFFLIAVNLYSAWLALNFVSVALSDAPLGRTLIILVIAVILSLLAMTFLMRLPGVLSGRGA